MRATRLALLAVCLVAHPLRADLVIPDNFTVTTGWTFERCETFGFTDGTRSTICVDGLAYLGQNTTTGIYGVTYDFWQTVLAPPPTGSYVFAGMNGFALDCTDAEGNYTWRTVGSLFFGSGVYLTSGVAYNDCWTETSRIVATSALFVGLDNTPSGFGFGDDRWGSVAAVTIPEPATVALVGSGLIALGMVTRRQRRRRET